MSAADPRPPSWSSVWLEARASGRDPLSALVSAGLCTAAEIAPSEPAVPSRPPPWEPPRRRLRCHAGLDPGRLAQVEAELAARVGVIGPGPGPGPARSAAVGPGEVGDRAGDGDRVSYDTRHRGPRTGH